MLFGVAALFRCRRRQLAQNAVPAEVRSGCEIQVGCIAVSGAVTREAERPQSIDCGRSAVGIEQCAFKLAGYRVKGMDSAIAEVSDQQPVTKRSEISRRQSNAPWCIHVVAVLHAQQQIAIGIEYAYKAQSGPVGFKFRTRLVLCECHHDVASHRLNSKRNIMLRQGGILKTSLGYLVELRVEDIDLAGQKVGGIEPGTV